MINRVNQRVQQLMTQILIIQKECHINLSKQLVLTLETSDKILKTIKRHIKEQKQTEFECMNMYDSVFQEIQAILRVCSLNLRLEKTDFQALTCKQKYIDQQIAKLKYPKLKDQILLNSKLTIDIEIQFYNLKTLCAKASKQLSLLPYVNTMAISPQQIDEFVIKICQNYNTNPFHNFTHAFGVFIFFLECYGKSQMKSWITDFQLFFGLVSCLCHDIQHNGKSTLYQIKIKSNLGVSYCNKSVMQRLHIFKTLQLLQKGEGWNPYKFLQKDAKIKAKRIITQCIMATDMSQHYDYVRSIKEKQLDKNNENNRQYLMEVLIHACDIGNPCMSFNNYVYWANLICMQFNNQAKMEQKMHVQVTQFLKFNSLSIFYKNQQIFAGNIVAPLWENITLKFPIFNVYTQNIKQNTKKVTEKFRKNMQEKQNIFEEYLNTKI